MQLGGAVRLASPGLTLESVQGRWRVERPRRHRTARRVVAPVHARDARQLPPDAARAIAAGGPSQLNLSTQQGALQLSGNGTVGAGGVRFRGEARAGSGDEAALANLLNIIGRRDGAAPSFRSDEHEALAATRPAAAGRPPWPPAC